MTNQHPITPPPELVQQWDEECESGDNSEVSNTFDALQWFASKAAQWGADQELEACVEWLGDAPVVWGNNGDLHPGSYLRAARRPKPPSLKEQAHDAYWVLRYGHGGDINETQKWNTIRRALEQLDD